MGFVCEIKDPWVPPLTPTPEQQDCLDGAYVTYIENANAAEDSAACDAAWSFYLTQCFGCLISA